MHRQRNGPYRHTRRAVNLFDNRQSLTALDLGCGIGSDTIFLLQTGFHVYAIDSSQDAIERLTHRATQHGNQLTTSVRKIESGELPEADLVVANHSLYFVSQNMLEETWIEMIDRIHPGGVFAGHFLGESDAWVQEGMDVSFVTRNTLSKMFRTVETVFHTDIVRDLPAGQDGLNKRWHVHTCIVRKV